MEAERSTQAGVHDPAHKNKDAGSTDAGLSWSHATPWDIPVGAM